MITTPGTDTLQRKSGCVDTPLAPLFITHIKI